MGKRIAAGALIGVFSWLIFAYLWWGRFEYRHDLMLAWTYLGAAAAVLASHLYFRDTRRQIGLRLDNTRQSLSIAWPPTLLLALAIFLWGFWRGRFHPALEQIPLIYIPWAVLQQYVLQGFLLRRFQSLTEGAFAAVPLAAALFAFYHLPNLPLMAASFLGALVWCWTFHRAPNLPVVACSQVLLALLLSGFFKFDGMGQFRVGKGGYPYRIFGDGVQVSAGYDAQGSPVIATLPGQDRESPSRIRVYRPEGTLLNEWTAFEEYGYSGNLWVGELGFGPGDEIAAAPGPGVRNPPQVRIFSLDGKELSRFDLPEYNGYGAFVSISRKRLLVTPGPGPQRPAVCFEYEPDGRLLRRWDLGMIGYENSARALLFPPSAPSSHQTSRLVLWPSYLSVNSAVVRFFDLDGRPAASWRAFNNDYGMNLVPVRLGPLEGYGLAAAPGPVLGHGAHVRVFNLKGEKLAGFPARREAPVCGANLAAVDLDGDQRDEIVVGGGNCRGIPAEVRVLSQQGKLLQVWQIGK